LGVSQIKLLILIPCYNEEQGIGKVIDKIPLEDLKNRGYDTRVMVIDNNSKDKTSAVAISRGAGVVFEPNQGKGNAIITGFHSIPADIDVVAMIDGDDSYDIREIHRLLEPIESNFCEVVVGTRLHGRMSNESMSGFNRIGNWLFTFMARVGYKTNVTDVCSGFYVWRRHVIDNLSQHLQSNSFSIEMEMIAKMARMGYSCYSVPISYTNREGTSSLRPIRDGLTIIHAWLRNLNWRSEIVQTNTATSKEAEAYYTTEEPKKIEIFQA